MSINYDYIKHGNELEYEYKSVLEGVDRCFYYFEVIKLGIRRDVMKVWVNDQTVVCSITQKFITKTGPKPLYKIINDKDTVLIADGQYAPITNNICLSPQSMCDIVMFGGPTAYLYNNVALES